jgi:hypothetical protein
MLPCSSPCSSAYLCSCNAIHLEERKFPHPLRPRKFCPPYFYLIQQLVSLLYSAVAVESWRAPCDSVCMTLKDETATFRRKLRIRVAVRVMYVSYWFLIETDERYSCPSYGRFWNEHVLTALENLGACDYLPHDICLVSRISIKRSVQRSLKFQRLNSEITRPSMPLDLWKGEGT